MEIFPYAWNVHETRDGHLTIRAFGMNDQNESVYVAIQNFLPYIYIELPAHIDWQEYKVSTVRTKLDSLVPSYARASYKLHLKKRKLYYAKGSFDNEDNYQDKMYSFLKCGFKSTSHIRQFVNKLSKPVYVDGVGNLKFKVHEMDANPVLQFMCAKNIKPAGWFSFKPFYQPVIGDDKESTCDHEIGRAHV